MDHRILIGFIVTLTISLWSIAFTFSFNSSEQYFRSSTLADEGHNATNCGPPLSPPPSVVVIQYVNRTFPTPLERRRHELDYLRRYPFSAECRTAFNNSAQAGGEDAARTPYNYARAALNSTHALRLLRAVIVYYPIDKVDHFEYEFRWLYRSWINMQRYEPARWRTDLVVFMKHDTTLFGQPHFFLNELNCSARNVRRSPLERPMCTLVPYEPINQRRLDVPAFASDAERYEFVLRNVSVFGSGGSNDSAAKNATDRLVFYDLLKRNLANYGYVDSILMAFDGYEHFKAAGYDLLIRSDMDVFLTPMFSTWLPRYCNDFYVGRGGYSNTFNSKRFRRIANDLGFAYANAQNMGSTWYSTPEQFRVVSYLTLFGMAYLAGEEFTQPERDGKVGTILWPEWHYGVLLLYGQHLALNHLIGSNQLKVVKLENLIDYPSANKESVFTRLHIHVFHGEDMFSKFVYRMGKYDKEEVKEADMHMVKYYCLKMALDAKRIDCKTLHQMLVNETTTKS